MFFIMYNDTVGENEVGENEQQTNSVVDDFQCTGNYLSYLYSLVHWLNLHGLLFSANAVRSGKDE